MKDYYLILDIDRGSNEEQIKQAYRRQVKGSHPDQNRALDGSRFRDVQEAYDVLSDPESRRNYNDMLDRSRASSVGSARREARSWSPGGRPHVWPTGSEPDNPWSQTGVFELRWHYRSESVVSDLAGRMRALRLLYRKLFEDWPDVDS